MNRYVFFTRHTQFSEWMRTVRCEAKSVAAARRMFRKTYAVENWEVLELREIKGE